MKIESLKKLHILFMIIFLFACIVGNDWLIILSVLLMGYNLVWMIILLIVTNKKQK